MADNKMSFRQYLQFHANNQKRNQTKSELI